MERLFPCQFSIYNMRFKIFFPLSGSRSKPLLFRPVCRELMLLFIYLFFNQKRKRDFYGRHENIKTKYPANKLVSLKIQDGLGKCFINKYKSIGRYRNVVWIISHQIQILISMRYFNNCLIILRICCNLGRRVKIKDCSVWKCPSGQIGIG